MIARFLLFLIAVSISGCLHPPIDSDNDSVVAARLVQRREGTKEIVLQVSADVMDCFFLSNSFDVPRVACIDEDPEWRNRSDLRLLL